MGFSSILMQSDDKWNDFAFHSLRMRNSWGFHTKSNQSKSSSWDCRKSFLVHNVHNSSNKRFYSVCRQMVNIDYEQNGFYVLKKISCSLEHVFKCIEAKGLRASKKRVFSWELCFGHLSGHHRNGILGPTKIYRLSSVSCVYIQRQKHNHLKLINDCFLTQSILIDPQSIRHWLKIMGNGHFLKIQFVKIFDARTKNQLYSYFDWVFQ